MQIVCVSTPGGAELFTSSLGHGEDPYAAVCQHGLRMTRLLDAAQVEGEIVLTVQAAPPSNRYWRGRRPRRRLKTGPRWDPHLSTAPGEVPQTRQRIAAYGIITSARGLLATEFSELTHVPGQWGLPGGGVEAGEQPADTVVREVWEETGQHIEIGELVDVQSDHWLGRAPNGVLEDFHAVRLVYSGSCPDPTDPVVHDVGGTTSAAEWVRAENVPRHRWTAGARALVDRNVPREFWG